MRAVIQRVSRASVTIDGQVHSQIGRGLLVLIGVEQGDAPDDAAYVARKIAGMRIFGDSQGKMNLSVADIGGEALLVSQFTLLGDCRKGRRPSFVDAAEPETGNRLYEQVCDLVAAENIPVGRGVFAADMQVKLVNDGPVTILLDSRQRQASS